MSSCSSGWHFSPEALFALLLCLAWLVLARWVAGKRDFPGRNGFVLSSMAAVWWLLAVVTEISAQAADCKMFWAGMAWPGVILTVTFWALFLWQYVNSENGKLPPRTLLALCVVPVLVWATALSNPLHGLFYLPASGPVSDVAGAPVRYVHGPLFFVAGVYQYCILLFSGWVVLRAAYLSHGRHRRHFVALWGISIIPMLAHFGYVIYGWTVFGFDPTPFSFVLDLFAFLLLIFRGRMFDLIPVARHLLLEALFDPVLVVNRENEVIEANPAALQLAGLTSEKVGLALVQWPVYGRQLCELKLLSADEELPLLELTDPSRFFQVHRRAIERAARSGRFLLGTMFYLRDVTRPHLSELRLAQELAVSEQRLKTISELHERMRDQALHDPLTGLFNRRYLDEFFDREQSRAQRDHQSLVLVLIDLDYFKALNDSYGHMVGDEVLKSIARFFEEHLRSSDLVFRIGGEEFLIILQGVSAAEAVGRVDHMRELFAATPVLTRADELKVTFSAGLACRNVHGNSLNEMMQAADKALYQAKREGRNRVLLAELPECSSAK